MTITEYVARHIAMKRKLGYQFTTNARILLSFARFADDRGEAFIRAETVLQWALESASQARRARKLHTAHAFAVWMHAEDTRHEVPPRDALGAQSYRRPRPHPMSIQDIRKLLSGAHAMPPPGTINPRTWHHMFGLMASSGLRISEAVALSLEDITDDGLVIRETKYRKSRMIGLHPTTRDALNRYLAVRRKETTSDEHLFVLRTGRPPSTRRAREVFRKLAEHAGIREPGADRGPTPHTLRHAFAVRSLENLDPGADPSRHMLALATYLGHTDVSRTYCHAELGMTVVMPS